MFHVGFMVFSTTIDWILLLVPIEDGINILEYLKQNRYLFQVAVLTAIDVLRCA